MSVYINYDKQLFDACYANNVSNLRDAIWHGARNIRECMRLSCYLGYFDVFIILFAHCNTVLDATKGIYYALSYTQRLAGISIDNDYHIINMSDSKWHEIHDRGFTHDRLRIVMYLLAYNDGQLPKYVKQKYIQRIVNAGYPLERLKFHKCAYNSKIIKNVAEIYRNKLIHEINTATINILDWDGINVTKIILNYVG